MGDTHWETLIGRHSLEDIRGHSRGNTHGGHTGDTHGGTLTGDTHGGEPGCALNAHPLAQGDWDFLWATGSRFTRRQDIIVHISIMCSCIMSIKVSQYSSVATVISCNSCFSYQNNTLLLH